MSAPPNKDKFDECFNALKETVLNLESMIEQAERVLRRARSRLDAIEQTIYVDENE